MSPYDRLGRRAFWKTGVAEQNPLCIKELYKKKFEIGAEDRIATAGSCFAQHIFSYLQRFGFRVIDAEPPPPGLTRDAARKYGYGIFSARYGNMYTIDQLLQLAKEAFNQSSPAHPVWENAGRFFDAQRPSVEPGGFETPEQVMMHREYHLARVREVISAADILIFTFGLTEAWIDKASGTVYPTAPGTIAGSYDEDIFAFKNFSFNEIYSSFLHLRDFVKSQNNVAKFILTVSPIPLVATASGQHVLLATTHSKAVLRAVAGQLSQEFEDVDYFPAYEIITAPFTRGMFFEANWRSVSDVGVAVAMRHFFAEHGRRPEGPPGSVEPSREAFADPLCEDILLDAFAP